MMKTTLTLAEQDALLERMCQWSNRWGIGSLLAFVLESMRPAAPLTGNFFIAIAPIANPLCPVSMHDLGLLLQQDDMPRRFRQRMEEIGKPKSKTGTDQS
jgi:hypothetical protein